MPCTRSFMSFAASFSIVGDAGAGIAESAEVLGGEERQAADVADGAGPPALLVFGADGLGGVFDDAQAVTRARCAMMLVMSATWPYRCTGMMRAHATAGGAIDEHAIAHFAGGDESLDGCGEMLNVSGSMSTNTGRAPTRVRWCRRWRRTCTGW